MITKLSMIGAALAMTAGAIIPAASAEARPYYNDGYYGRGYNGGYYNGGYNGGYYNNGYRGYDRGYRYQDRRYYQGYRCRSDGAGGTIIGAIAGGLIGNAAVGRYGDRTAGTIVGAGVGALAGRAIDRSDSRC
ncbi:MAG: hypothetical protein DI623_02455 [Sphingomonas sanxanigenens]|uniref:17 kDa surface antigen n=1 Tax=Sphingomonas sanxanigenens TaxID=397260 RepID=A0A2W5AHB5_9SPHN|nr:MAG: hypothetical protein DI623_02455 [Sphingomonas sanxanigenens]